MNKITLTSTLAILIAGPAMAAVGDATFTAGQNVANSCVVGVLGVDTGTAQTNAYWNPNTYSCAAGTYLPDGDTWSSDNQYTSGNCQQCPANSYCGGGNYTYSEANDQGKSACPSGYTLSAAGSSAQTDCYRVCAAADVPHLKSGGTMTGNYYYNNNNQCAPADAQQCATGYHYVAGARTPDLNTILSDQVYWGFGGETVPSSVYGYIGLDGASRNASSYNLTENGTFAVMFEAGTVRGRAQCSNQAGTNNDFTWSNPTMVQTLPDSTGANCFCRLESYTPSGETSVSISAMWVFSNEDDATNCSGNCIGNCVNGMLYTQAADFRTAMFNSISAGPASCQANTININWKDASGNTHELGSCTYDGALTTPTTAPTKRGHTFGGWKFVAQ